MVRNRAAKMSVNPTHRGNKVLKLLAIGEGMLFAKTLDHTQFQSQQSCFLSYIAKMTANTDSLSF